MIATLPKTSQDITAEWLNQVLAQTTFAKAGPIVDFDREIIGQEAGFVGELTRISLRYHGDRGSAPPTLIAKLPTADDAVRTMATLFGFYERENRFYQEIAPQVVLRTPICYYNAMDVPTGRFVLLLEDLAPARCGDQLGSCSLDDAKLALASIAQLHAAWWDSPRLKQFDWLPALDDTTLRQMLHAVYQQSWPAFLEAYRETLPGPIIEIGRKFGEQFPDLADALSDRPRTIMHTDFRLDNMFFGVDGANSFALIDWQLVQQGIGPIDVAYFLAGNFPIEVRRRRETELLQYYHQALEGLGVQNYSYEQCHEDYRRAMLFLLVFIVSNRENVDIGTYGDRAQALLATMIERYTTAIMDVDAGAFLS